MVAYSFKQRFRAPILAGTKDQTIRADRKRHARPGEQVQLYTAMRTRQCTLIGRSVCQATMPVRLDLDCGRVEFMATGTALTTPEELDGFAHTDGFKDWRDMLAFWRQTHPDLPVFSGVLIRWLPLDADTPSDAPRRKAVTP